MSKFIASLGVSVTLHLFHELYTIQSPFVEFAFHKFTQIWHIVKSHSNVCSCRLQSKLCFCASFVLALKKTLSVPDGGSVLKSLPHFIS